MATASIPAMKKLFFSLYFVFGFSFIVFGQSKLDPGKFTKFTGIEKPVNLKSGEKLLCIFNLECDDCQATASLLKDMKKTNKSIPSVYVLFYKEGDTTPEKFGQITGTNFPNALLSVDDFFNVIGDYPPRIYYLKDGVIKGTWDNDFAKHLKETFPAK